MAGPASATIAVNQAESLASHGYIVVAADHTYGAVSTRFPRRNHRRVRSGRVARRGDRRARGLRRSRGRNWSARSPTIWPGSSMRSPPGDPGPFGEIADHIDLGLVGRLRTFHRWWGGRPVLSVRRALQGGPRNGCLGRARARSRDRHPGNEADALHALRRLAGHPQRREAAGSGRKKRERHLLDRGRGGGPQRLRRHPALLAGRRPARV